MRTKVINIIIYILLLICSISDVKASGNDDKTVNFGVMKYFLNNVNINDAKVAMNGWVSELAKEYKKKTGIALNFNLFYYDDINEMLELVKSKKLDVLTLSSYDYLLMDFNKYINPLLMDKTDERLIKVMLVRKDDNIQKLSDLESKNIILEPGIDGVFGRYWLNRIAKQNGINDYLNFFNSVDKTKNSNMVIMQLFFGKTDACITSMFNFNTSAEINPQIKEKIKILYNSDKIIYSVTGIRKDCKTVNGKILTDIATDVVGNSTMQSMMELFKKGAVIKYNKEYETEINSLIKYNTNDDVKKDQRRKKKKK